MPNFKTRLFYFEDWTGVFNSDSRDSYRATNVLGVSNTRMIRMVI